MKLLYAIALIILSLLLNTNITHAQSWRWGARGGSAGIEYVDWETVKDMAVDQNGNVYVLSNSYEAGLNVTGGGPSVTGKGRQDILITSYRCDGSFRWKKLIGGPDDDFAFSIQVDSLGGVYAAFSLVLISSNSPKGYIDSDDTVFGSTNKSLYLVKYDTAGNYKWLKSPQPDTISTPAGLTYTGTIDMNVDGSGNVYWLCHLPPAAYENGAFVVINSGLYIIKYNAQGVYQGLITMDMYRSVGAAGIKSLRMQRDYRTGRFYICGTYLNGLFTMGGNTITKTMFVGAFNDNGNLIWNRTNTVGSVGSGFYFRPVIDDSAHIYLGGEARRPDTFNSYPIMQIGGNGGNSSRPFIVKMDSNGNNLWALDALPTAATGGRGGLALRNKDEIVFTGDYPSAIRWPGFPDTLHHNQPGGTYLTFITRFNVHTGKVLGMERLPTVSGTQPTATISDGKNNIYIGGEFQGQLNINGSTYLKTGGNTDWYIAKYGHDNCSCTSGPNNGLFSKNYLNDSTVQFTATSFANDDTLYWDFGDNNDTSLLTSPTHTYSDTGTFTVCLTITNGCGDTTICDTVRINKFNSIRNINSGELVRIYPNPANEILHIDGIYPGSRIEMYDVLGRKAHMITTASKEESINITHLPPGNYFIQITLPSGERITGKVLKQ